MWRPYQNGTTIGATGSEQGLIIQDEEHPGGGITLEKKCGKIPFAVTCGIYGVMVHTVFANETGTAEQLYGKMRNALVKLLENDELDEDSFAEEINQFVDAFP